VPETLVRFVPSEWPGELWDGYQEWKAARREWAAAHPDSVLGDVVDQLRAELAARRRLTCPPG
jgi:hypothetical protein